MNKVCKCRHCGAMYNPQTSRADLQGYCSQKCLHAEAKKYGYKKTKGWSSNTDSEYDVLKRHNRVGSINEFGDACDMAGRKLGKRAQS